MQTHNHLGSRSAATREKAKRSKKSQKSTTIHRGVTTCRASILEPSTRGEEDSWLAIKGGATALGNLKRRRREEVRVSITLEKKSAIESGAERGALSVRFEYTKFGGNKMVARTKGRKFPEIENRRRWRSPSPSR